MPKTPATKKRKIENAIQEFGKDTFTYEKHNIEKRLWRKLCSTANKNRARFALFLLAADQGT